MSELYLTRLALHEFRSFSHCDITLPNSPSVLLVSGPNGLGKSTLFDALEWCLAGEIDRFNPVAKGVEGQHYLRRWGAPSELLTSVEATFGKGNVVSRQLTTADPTGVVAGVPLDLLRSQNWAAKIGGLHHYLLLTHFLGQSTLTRMTHRDARDRWEYLKGPAQSDWAQEIGAALHGHGNSGEAKAYISAVASARALETHIEHLLHAEQVQFEAARAAGGLSSEQVVSEARDAIARLSSLQVAALDLQIEDNATAPEQLERLESAVSAVRYRLTQRDTALRQAHTQVARHVEAQGRLGQVRQQLAEAQARLRDIDGFRAQLSTTLAAAKEGVSRAAAEVQRSEQRLRAMEHVRELIGARDRQRQSIAAQDEEGHLVGRRSKDVEAKVTQTQRRMSLAQRTQAMRSEVLRALEAVSFRLAVYEDLAEIDRDLAEQETALAAREASSPNLSSQLASARARRTIALEQHDNAQQGLEFARKAVADLAAAVVRVVAHIDDTSCICPVCASEFEAGELQRRARATASALGPTLAPLEALAVNTARAVEDATADLRRLQAEQANIDSLRENVAALRATRAERASQVDVETDVDSARATEADLAARLQERAARLERWVSVLGTPAALQQVWSSELFARNTLERQLTELRSAQAAARQALRNTEEDLVSAATELGLRIQAEWDVEGPLREARETLAASRSQHLEAEASRECAVKALEDHALDAAAIAIRQAELHAAARLHEQERDAAIDAWRQLGMDGDISIEELTVAERLAESARGRLDFAEQNLSRLRDGYNVGLQQEIHGRTLAQLRQGIGAPSDADRETTRQLATELQTAAAKRTQKYMQAQRIAQGAWLSLNEQVGAFNRRYLRPVNELMSRINRAILTEPDVGLKLEFNRNAVSQKTRRLMRAPASVESLDPILVHSEGQMAALAVSMLCAASLTFPWSRWRALVLDDPLQHNDVVHASAFADLMRGLVRERRYQILLSTHDAGLADFLRRKFVAGGVPCTTVHLLGQGEVGTEIEIKKFNTAAIQAGERPAAG